MVIFLSFSLKAYESSIDYDKFTLSGYPDRIKLFNALARISISSIKTLNFLDISSFPSSLIKLVFVEEIYILFFNSSVSFMEEVTS